MAKRNYTKEEKDKILDRFRKRVLVEFFVLPIIVALAISIFLVYFL